MSYIKSNEFSDDELTILRVQETPEISIAPSFAEYPPKFIKNPIQLEETQRKNYPNFYNDILDDLELIDKKLVKIVSDTLFEWQDVQVIFPPSIIGIDQCESPLAKENSLFRVSFENELEEVSRDPITGKTKRLNKQQLDSIKKTGSFQVESNIFRGKSHKWVLAKWIQKGSLNTKKAFYKELSIALSLLIITAKRRFYAKKFSFLDGLKSWLTGFKNLLDIFIGIPATVTRNYSDKIRKDLKEFLLADLVAHKDPYHFTTPQNLEVDIYLFKTDLSKEKKLKSLLDKLLVLNTSEKENLDRLKIETIDLFKSENLSKEQIKKRTEKILFKEFLKVVYDKIRNCQKLEAEHPGLRDLLINKSKSTLIIKEVMDECQQEIKNHMDAYNQHLKQYKIRSLISPWIDEKMQAERERITNQNPYEIHMRSIEKCKEQNLNENAYFLEREMEFFKQRADFFVKEYEKIKDPVKVFYFKRFIWLPKNYIIKNVGKEHSPNYILEKSIYYKNSSSNPFWRWTNFIMRTGVNFLNFIFLFGIVVPFSSPVSLTALFSFKPFYPGKDINPRTGTLIQSRIKVNSYISRLRALWDHIRSSRQKFESTPDRGLIGKGLQRIFNVFWNYVVKGLFGTIGLTLINPAVCLTCSFGSLALCITTPLWVPIFSIIQHLGFVLIWDWDYLGKSYFPRLFRLCRILIWDFFICGILQPVSALATSLVFCPIASLSILIFSLVSSSSRRFWDIFIFHVVLKRNAKIPSSDTFIARRVEGPGLALDYFVQAKPEQILAALEAALEIKIVNSYLKNIHSILEQPQKNFEKLIDQIFKKYSLKIDPSLEPFKLVCQNVSKNIEKYDKAANKRLKHLNKLIENHESSKIRLSETDLKIVIMESMKTIKKHYLESILIFSNKTPHDLFVENNLCDNDWKGFAEIELENLFGKGFLCPLEETDYYFSLSIDHLNLAKYTEMLTNSEIRDDLDKVKINYTPKSEILAINNQFKSINHFYGSISDENFSNSSALIEWKITIKSETNFN